MVSHVGRQESRSDRGRGFIGSHLVEALVAAGASVTAVVRYNSGSLIGNLAFLDPEGP